MIKKERFSFQSEGLLKQNMSKLIVKEKDIRNKIFTIRNQQVMLDSDLADLYQVETRVLNQAVKRNAKRFPKEYMFQLSEEEFDFLKSQFVISKENSLTSRSVTLKNKSITLVQV